jgi:AraC family transcriptional regulator of adaptative response/methylated-DNA-[protein]-cysteine methyltransferase
MMTTMKKHSGSSQKPLQTVAGDDYRWDAVVRRDAKADGEFYYSVRTTGVYCRPSCGARRPLRANVQFHLSHEEAERAGFRPCKRCRPDRPTLAQQQAAKVIDACRRIETADETPGLGELAQAAGMSRFHFHRVFKRVAGLTPKAYASVHRAKKARANLLRKTTVTEAIYSAGFNSNGRFYATYSRMLGMKPRTYRRGGTGEAIRFAVGECSLGSILVAASEKGLCAVFLGDDPDRLARELQDRFPGAQLIGGDRKFERIVAKVIGFVESPKVGLELPLDVRGTAFQQKVWRALQKIPEGSTSSYAKVAARIGSPKSVRAVASACAANAIAVAIPCHRVVRTDGSLSGYRWGVERKHLLLKREASRAAPA